MFKALFISTGILITSIYQAQDLIREIVRGMIGM